MAMWGATPKWLQDFIAMSVDRVQGGVTPPPPHPDVSKHFRVLVGPVNYAGQGFQWSRALEVTGEVSAVNFVHVENNPLRYQVDYEARWRTSEHSRKWQRGLLNALGTDFTHVLVEASVPLVGGAFKSDMIKQVRAMEQRGAKVALIAHGTEARLPSRHAAGEPWSHLVGDMWTDIPNLERTVERNLRIIEDLNLPTFVATAGLLLDLPHAHFLGVIVDPAKWATDSRALVRRTPLVVHAPTQSHVKGTTLIEPRLTRLIDSGVLKYRRIDGKANSEMPRILAEADILLDQFRIGDYGVAACEAMAAQRLVIGHVSDQVRLEVERHAGVPLPIVEANPENVDEVLEQVLADRPRFAQIAATGPEFVRSLHDGRFSQRVLMDRFLRA